MEHSATRSDDRALRALVVTNMYPTAERPEFGSFVRDQVDALRRLPGVTVELSVLDGGGIGSYGRAVTALRRRYATERFDVVHAHYGLTAWPALAVRAGVHAVTLHGTDLADRRARPVTLAALPWLDIVGAASEPLAASIPRWALRHGPASVLPCGIDVERFHPIDRAAARTSLGLDPERRCLLFPADPARPEKRFDRAAAVRDAVGSEFDLLTLGGVDPARVPLLVNAADVVLIPSEREGFGLAVLEALACEVPVISTPVGVAPEALAGVPGTLCAPFSVPEWAAAVRAFLAAAGPEASGRAAASRYSAHAMAERVLGSWRDALRTTSGR